MSRVDTAAHRMVRSIAPPRAAERECRLCGNRVSVHLFEHVDPTVCSVWCARNDPREPSQSTPTGEPDATPADAGTLPWHGDAEPDDFIAADK